MIPILDLKKQILPIREEIDAAIKEVIDSANFILGKQVEDFESAVCAYCGVKFAVGVSSGTDAIKLALIALGIKPGQGVICPAFTYYATAGAIASMGAVPFFADIEPDTFNISPVSVEKVLIAKAKGKIRAIIPVHLYGQCADMDSILKIAQKYKVKVIEDTAQAFGAEYKAVKAGTIADCGAVSFFPGKNLGAFGDAGMVLTNDKTVSEALRLLRNQGNQEKYYHSLLGFNHRMDTLQAAVLKVKLKYLDSWNRKRQVNAALLAERLIGLPLKPPFAAPYSTHTYHQFVLRLEKDRDQLIAHLKNKGIDARIYYPLALHLQKCFKNLGYKSGDFPESEKASRQTLAIPVYPDLEPKEIDYITGSIRELFTR